MIRLKKSATDTLKTAWKRAIQKTAEATGDLIGSKITDKITRFSKTSPQDSSGRNEENNIEKDIYLRNKENYRWSKINIII